MIKLLFVMNILLTITALVYWVMGVKYLKNDKYNKKAIKYILNGTSVTGISIVLNATLFLPIFFPI